MTNTARRIQFFIMVMYGFTFNFFAKGGSLPFWTEQRAVLI